jgi:hypothetical protein
MSFPPWPYKQFPCRVKMIAKIILAIVMLAPYHRSLASPPVEPNRQLVPVAIARVENDAALKEILRAFKTRRVTFMVAYPLTNPPEPEFKFAIRVPGKDALRALRIAKVSCHHKTGMEFISVQEAKADAFSTGGTGG